MDAIKGFVCFMIPITWICPFIYLTFLVNGLGLKPWFAAPLFVLVASTEVVAIVGAMCLFDVWTRK